MLLKAGRLDDAHRLTERILTRRPGFRGLADITGVTGSVGRRARRGGERDE
ncbi:hypothetical protein ABZ519_19760 [Streptomyces collinus]|uniref:hypothetical protein n=1 Tax=Streptomyces collinus TaxID=42684 RepID=UPI00160F8792